MGGLAAGGVALVLDNDEHGSISVSAAAAPDSKTYTLAPFTQIATSGPQDVVVSYGEKPSVRAEGSAESLAWLEPTVTNGKLTIKPRDGFNWTRWAMLEPTTFYVTVPRLDRVAAAGSGDVSVDQVKGESFEGTVTGSGELSINAMDVDRASFAANASGDVVVVGTARETHVEIGGSGTVDGGGLRSKTASVVISGSGDVELAVDDTADVSVGGSGNVDISGTARCSVTRYASGEVDCDGGGGTND